MIWENIITDKSKESAEILTVSTSCSFQFSCVTILNIFKELSTTSKFPSNGFLKNKCKIARRNSYKVRHVNPPSTYRKLHQSPKPKFCF